MARDHRISNTGIGHNITFFFSLMKILSYSGTSKNYIMATKLIVRYSNSKFSTDTFDLKIFAVGDASWGKIICRNLQTFYHHS